MRVLVCGGRAYANQHWIFTVLTCQHMLTPFTELIHGDAGNVRVTTMPDGLDYEYTLGADKLAGKWAESVEIPVRVFRANWRLHGGAAGPIRNGQMLRDGKPDLVIAFPGGRGTANMIQQARAAGVKIYEPGEPR